MSTIVLAAVCLMGLVLVAAIVAGLMLMIRAGDSDTVSTAREDWITRRSDDDDRRW